MLKAQMRSMAGKQKTKNTPPKPPNPSPPQEILFLLGRKNATMETKEKKGPTKKSQAPNRVRFWPSKTISLKSSPEKVPKTPKTGGGRRTTRTLLEMAPKKGRWTPPPKKNTPPQPPPPFPEKFPASTGTPHPQTKKKPTVIPNHKKIEVSWGYGFAKLQTNEEQKKREVGSLINTVSKPPHPFCSVNWEELNENKGKTLNSRSKNKTQR